MFRILFSFALGVVLVALAGPAYAQGTRDERPYRGLFGNGGSRSSGRSLIGEASLGAGHYQDLLDESASALVGDDGGRQRGSVGHLSGALNYSQNSERLSLDVSGALAARYYPSAERQVLRSSSAQFLVGVPIRRRTTVSLLGSVSNQPFTFVSLFPSPFSLEGLDGVAPDLDLAASTGNYLAYDGTLSLGHELSGRTSVSGSYNYRKAGRTGIDGDDFVHQRVGGTLTHALGRGLSLRGGYNYSQGLYGDGRRLPIHGIDVGLDYSKALSFSRRTTLSFGTGSMASRGVASVDDLDGGFRYHITGNVQLNHEIGRTWAATAGYDRQVVIHEAFTQPLLADGFTATFGGLVNRQLQVTSQARVWRGTLSGSSQDAAFTTYYAGVAAELGLNRFTGVSLSYVYYKQPLGIGVPLAFESSGAREGQGVLATVKLWAPIYERGRRSNGSR